MGNYVMDRKNEEKFVLVFALIWLIANLLCYAIFGGIGFVISNLFFILVLFATFVARTFSSRVRKWFDE